MPMHIEEYMKIIISWHVNNRHKLNTGMRLVLSSEDNLFIAEGSCFAARSKNLVEDITRDPDAREEILDAYRALELIIDLILVDRPIKQKDNDAAIIEKIRQQKFVPLKKKIDLLFSLNIINDESRKLFAELRLARNELSHRYNAANCKYKNSYIFAEEGFSTFKNDLGGFCEVILSTYISAHQKKYIRELMAIINSDG